MKIAGKMHGIICTNFGWQKVTHPLWSIILKPRWLNPVDQLWRLAGQVIADAYHHYGSPLQRLEKLKNPPKATHIYSLDRNDEYLALQQRFALAHDFFKVKRLENARTHLAILERPQDVLAGILESI